jgi:sugar phosphate isomerase/epimerase
MKFLLSSYCLEPFPLEETFLFAKEIGADGIELVLVLPVYSEGLKLAKELSEKHQIPIVSLHQPPWGVFFTGKSGIKRLIKKAEFLGCKNIIVHLATLRRTFNSHFFDWIKKIEKESGINVAFENSAKRSLEMFPTYAGSDPEKLEEFIKDRKVNITFDVAKGILCGMDPYQFFQRNKNSIKVMHFHGFNRNSDYHIGFIRHDFDWSGFMSFVKKFDSDVVVTIEIFPMHKLIHFNLPSRKVFETTKSFIRENFEILKRA